MSTINQATTITGEYSGFADSELRALSADFMQTSAMTAYQPAGDYATEAYVNSAVSAADPNIFWAIYGTTTYEDTLAAYNAGKKIFMKDGAIIAACSHKGGSPDTFYFNGIRVIWQPGGPTFNYYQLSSRDGWYRQTGYTLQADWNQTHDYYASFIRNKPDLSVYATTEDVESAVSAKLDTTAFSDVSGSFLTEVPATYLQNTDLSTEDGKVTAISGIPLSAGGDVPEGVMVESGLEYNAVNEISSYNGSAIAQYGAEKQWLVHDDTLVHAANSAQYALGVNLSAVAQLLGVDETVLWEGSAAITSGYQNIATNEPATSFKAIKIYGESWRGWAPVIWGEVSGDNHQFSLAPSYLGANGAAIRICQIMFNYADSGYEVGNGRLFSLQGSTVTTQEPQNTWLRKIVGVGRKA